MGHSFKTADIFRILAFSALFGLARAVFQALWIHDSLSPELRVFLCAAILCAVFVFLFSFLLCKITAQRAGEDITRPETAGGFSALSRKHFFILFLFVNTVALLTWFPGTTYYDTLLIYFNRMTMLTQFPPLYCLWVTALADLGRALHYPRLTMILFSITQILAVSAMMAQISHWIWRKTLPRLFKAAAILFLALNPIYGMYAIAAIKDTLASLALVVMVTVLYDMAVEDGAEDAANWRILALCMVFPLSFRSNGFSIILILLTAMLFRFRKHRRRVLFLFAELLLFQAAEKLLYWHFGIRPFIQEALAIPIQQLCATVVWGGQLNEEQAAFINSLLPLDVIREVYNPAIVDPVKWNAEFGGGFLRENLPDFFRVWLQLLPGNFWIYVKAYLLQTLGYWAPANLGTTEIFTAIEGLHRDYLAANQLVVGPVWGNGSLQAILERYYRSAARFPSEGIWIWLMFFCCFIRGLIKKDRQSILIFAPCLLCWLSLMLAAPVYTGTRYALSFLYGIPVFLVLAAV